MKVAIIGANGKVGYRIVDAAVNKGYETTAIMRREQDTNAQSTLLKDVFSLTKEDLKDFDIVVSALGFWKPEHLIQHEEAALHLANILKNTDTTLMIVGGAGSMYTDDSLTQRLVDTPNFPKEFKPLASAMANTLTALRNIKDMNWIYVSPAISFDDNIRASNGTIIGGEVLFFDSNKKSQISYDDYAVAFVDLFTNVEKYNHQRISIIGQS